MLNPWFDITFQAARLGFEAQSAAALQLMRLVGGTSKTEVRGMVADKIAAPPDVPAAAAPPVVQAAATKVASDGGRRRESVNKVHKKRSRANKRKRSKLLVLGIRGQQKEKHDVDRHAIDCVEFHRFLQFGKQPEGALQIRQTSMRNGDAAAYSCRSEFLPLEKIRTDLINAKTDTDCCFGSQFLQQLAFIDSSNAYQNVVGRQNIRNFHDGSGRRLIESIGQVSSRRADLALSSGARNR